MGAILRKKPLGDIMENIPYCGMAAFSWEANPLCHLGARLVQRGKPPAADFLAPVRNYYDTEIIR
jgi:hypothetical protein